jgi:alpha-amylase/alpha-mannosidase (GH57 family)
MADHYLCVHGHFYQNPRGDPFQDDALADEPGAEPYRNFYEKVTAECYAPNAELGNFDLISFNVGSHLARWMEKERPDTYQRIMAADRKHLEQWGVGNALAQPTSHTILPLCNTRDKVLQIRWGLMSFEHRYGRKAEGLWLPEAAVDLETLQILHDNGITFTILSQGQVTGANRGAGPYWVNLPSGDRLAVFIRDDWHSNQLAFHIQDLGGAGRWTRGTLAPLRRDYGRMILLAVDGETFGYHHPGEQHFLHWLVSYEAQAIGLEVTTLARDVRDHPPTEEITLKEYSAWSCAHGLARWSTGCDCTAGDTRWKGALRRAYDNLANQVDDAYVAFARKLGTDPWPLRENFFRVYLGQISESQLLAEAGLQHITALQAESILDLLRAQVYRQRMYVSSTFFYEDLDRAEPRYSIANAVRALRRVQEGTGQNFTAGFRRDLTQATSNRTSKTGAQILEEVLATLPAK